MVASILSWPWGHSEVLLAVLFDRNKLERLHFLFLTLWGIFNYSSLILVDSRSEVHRLVHARHGSWFLDVGFLAYMVYQALEVVWFLLMSCFLSNHLHKATFGLFSLYSLSIRLPEELSVLKAAQLLLRVASIH